MTNRRIFVGLLIILIGLSSLFEFSVARILVALIIIWIGVRILLGHSRRFDFETRGQVRESFLRRVLIFSGINHKVVSDNFEGLDIVAIFGGGEIDLAGVKIKKSKIDMDLVAIFGGIKVRIPKDWDVKSDGIGILGGFQNNTRSVSKSVTTVYLKGAAIFGGVEVVN